MPPAKKGKTPKASAGSRPPKRCAAGTSRPAELSARRHRCGCRRKLQSVLPLRTRVELLFFDRADDARPSRIIELDPGTPPDLSLLARVRAGGESRPALRLSRPWALRSGARHAVRCHQGAAGSLWPRSGGAAEVQSPGRRAARRQCRHRDEERGRGSKLPTTGKATRLCTGLLRGRSFTRCTCAASPAIRVPAWRRRSVAPTPA